ncbi:hypothetical protein V2J09_017680 [Rumex salicifolius]
MQSLLQLPSSFCVCSHTPPILSKTKTKTQTLLKPYSHSRVSFPSHHPRKCNPPKAYAPDEVPVDEEFLAKFGPKEKDSEEESRRRNWVERGWAPWEEILTPEADFARKSLNEGEEVALTSPEAIEAFRMLRPTYVKKKIHDMGISEDDYYASQFQIRGEKLEPLDTVWDGPLVVRHVAPRDWPPRGWQVDRDELEIIREGHKMMAERVSLEQLEGGEVVVVTGDGESQQEGMCLDRYKLFLNQYNHWVHHNKEKLEQDSYKYDQDYHPGRRKRGKDYQEGMYELPFYYPGQLCVGKVTTLHLYQGAFVDIGGVYDGWVPIKDNDWYWIRQHIKVGMQVIVEVLAKRDPYRYRFPIELRFVDPNIDHLIFNRFEYAPIFHRDEDTNPDELRRDCGRPPLPMKDPGIKWEEEPLLSNHPYVDKLWQIHVAEQMVLDDLEANPDKYKGKKLSELTDEEEFDDEHSVEYEDVYYKKTKLPKMVLKTRVRELDLEAALAERELNNKLEKEAEERGEEFKIHKMRRNIEMDEYDLIHWRRSFEEREALIRDMSNRRAVGLPLEEPGRYVDASAFGDQYDPTNPLYRYDYWGEPKNSEKSKLERITDAHNKSIVGKGSVWYEMSYEEAMKQKERKAARSPPKGAEEQWGSEDDGEGSDDDDFDYSILGDSSADYAAQPRVNGTESIVSDDGLFED